MLENSNLLFGTFFYKPSADKKPASYGLINLNNFTGKKEFPDGTKYWFKEGKCHREDGPAIESPYGTKSWYKEGILHRENGPAIEYSDGSKEWWFEGKLHRENKPAIENANGSKHWYKEGKRHREDGPAIELSDGTKEWHLKGKEYKQINLKDYVVLDSYQGEYGLMWYKILGKDQIIEYPDIPELINKE